jgi:hemoglobin
MTDPPNERPELPSLFALMGGEAVVHAISARFYDVMDETEPELARLHQLDAHGKVAQGSRDRFALFFIEWLGGPRVYSPTYGHPRLRMRHAKVRVDTSMRDAWLRCMARALTEAKLEPGVHSFVEMRLAEAAEFLRNAPEPT